MKISSSLHLVSRFLMGFIFLASGIAKTFAFHQSAASMVPVGFPMPEFVLCAAIFLEVGGGLSLMLGFHTRHAAGALIFFVVPATIILHTRLVGDPVSGQEQIVHTLKNIAIIGGLLKFVADGGGPFSLDSRYERKEIVI